MNEYRINLLGMALPWWDDKLRFGEFRRCGFTTWQRAADWALQYNRYAGELRHATMLEF